MWELRSEKTAWSVKMTGNMDKNEGREEGLAVPRPPRETAGLLGGGHRGQPQFIVVIIYPISQLGGKTKYKIHTQPLLLSVQVNGISENKLFLVQVRNEFCSVSGARDGKYCSRTSKKLFSCPV